MFVELHSPLFLGKKNHGTKVFNGKTGADVQYDEDKDKITISYHGETAHVQHYNYFVVDTQEVKQELAPRGPGRPIKAQVSTPQDHVFMDGPGKSRN